MRCARAALVAALALGASACPETKTPVEAPAFVSPTPLPTAGPGSPASLYGLVTYHGTGASSATVACQGRLSQTRPDGTYRLDGVTAGKTVVTVQYFVGDYQEPFSIALNAGANEIDFDCSLPGCNR